MKYKIAIIIGEAGSGKDTILRMVASANPNLNEIVSCTTRPKREGEVEGVNYYYLTEKQFLQKIKDNQMLEHTSFRKWFYGTSLDALMKNKINIGVFNPGGVYNLLAKSNTLEIKVFRIVCDDKQRLLR